MMTKEVGKPQPAGSLHSASRLIRQLDLGSHVIALRLNLELDCSMTHITIPYLTLRVRQM